MSGRYYVIDNRIKKSNTDFKVNRGPAAVIYLRTPNNYIAGKEGEEEDRKRAIISVSVIMVFVLFYIIMVMVTNNTAHTFIL